MSTYGLPAEIFPATDTAPALPVLGAPEREAAILINEARIIDEVVKAQQALYGPEVEAEEEHFDLFGKELPATPIPMAGAEERQRVALADLEVYKRAASSPALKAALGETGPIDFWGYNWHREDDGNRPVYTEVALLNPNLALLLSFDLDEDGYATGSKARLFMSKDPLALTRAVRLATGSEYN